MTERDVKHIIIKEIKEDWSTAENMALITGGPGIGSKTCFF